MRPEKPRPHVTAGVACKEFGDVIFPPFRGNPPYLLNFGKNKKSLNLM
jgi:hypothetical protein